MAIRIPPREFHFTAKKLRDFFEPRGFIEVHTQSCLDILAACEDPKTIAPFHYNGVKLPLPQTGQMKLEEALLNDPSAPGFFCLSTSFRNEPNPIPGRHEPVFPMFEFELMGTMSDLRQMEYDLLEHLGFQDSHERELYDSLAERYCTDELKPEHETRMGNEIGSIVFLELFPVRTSPFWNMKRNRNGKYAHKIDVILYGQETIGSAERSTDPQQMHHDFLTISDGQYAQILFNEFGEKRVMQELEEFLSLNFFPRVGGGIGMTRMIRALKEAKILKV